MDLMMALSSSYVNSDLINYLEINKIGLELQSYGLKGVSSEESWNEVYIAHKKMRKGFSNRIAIHGPFIGIHYGHYDHLLSEGVENRMNKVFDIVEELKPDTLILHTGYTDVVSKFKIEDQWLDSISNYWISNIKKYEKVGTRVVLENLAETEPYLMKELAERVKSEYFGLCLDVGHVNLVSNLKPEKWIKELKDKLYHIHLHDNKGDEDSHKPLGEGNINFETFFKALKLFVPDVTISLEVESDSQTLKDNLNIVLNNYF